MCPTFFHHQGGVHTILLVFILCYFHGGPADHIDGPADPINDSADPIDSPADPIDGLADPIDGPADHIDDPPDPIDSPADPIDGLADPIDGPAVPNPLATLAWLVLNVMLSLPNWKGCKSFDSLRVI